MEATRILMAEHRVIELVIHALEEGAQSLERGREVRPGFFMDAADFIMGFADGCHHKKEEGILFKAMVGNGVPAEGWPVGVMLYEHERERAFARAIRTAALRLAADPSARRAVIHNARGYSSMLKQHIQKEDEVLFPMADRFIPLEKQEQVTKAFETIEHEEIGEGVHEKYLALAEALDQEAARALTEA